MGTLSISLASGSKPTLVRNWQQFSNLYYIDILCNKTGDLFPKCMGIMLEGRNLCDGNVQSTSGGW